MSNKVYAGSRVVGEVRENIFRKSIDGSRHFFRNPPGIGNDISALDDAVKAGASWVMVYDRESGRTYTAQVSSIYSKGIPRDYGFGAQLILPFKYWAVSKGENQPAEQLAFSTANTTPAIAFEKPNTTKQLGLFSINPEAAQ